MSEPRSVTLQLKKAPHADAGVVVSRRAAEALRSDVSWQLDITSAEGEVFTPDVVGAELDERGVIAVGSEVKPGTILVGRIVNGKDRSLRCSPEAVGRVADVKVETTGKTKAKRRTTVTVTVSTVRELSIGDVLRLDDGRVDVVAELVDDLGGADLGWPDAEGMHAVERVAMAETTLHARSIGPYSLVTQQPLGGKGSFGGQRVGGPELDALEARGATWIAHEMLTTKSDDVQGRMRMYESIVVGRPACEPTVSRATQVLERELVALGFDVDLTKDQVGIRLLDDAAIRARMPGAIAKPETLNYRTLRPELGGLFCEELFGPVTDPEERSSRFARIELASPVLHPWLFDATATLLAIEPSTLRRILYGERALATDDRPETPDSTGTIAIRAALAALDLGYLAALGGERGELAQTLLGSNTPVADFCHDAWPVLPPDLRPLVPLDDGRFATSDLNDLYRRVINRNNRMRRLLELRAPEVILINEAA